MFASFTADPLTTQASVFGRGGGGGGGGGGDAGNCPPLLLSGCAEEADPVNGAPRRIARQRPSNRTRSVNQSQQGA